MKGLHFSALHLGRFELLCNYLVIKHVFTSVGMNEVSTDHSLDRGLYSYVTGTSAYIHINSVQVMLTKWPINNSHAYLFPNPTWYMVYISVQIFSSVWK